MMLLVRIILALADPQIHMIPHKYYLMICTAANFQGKLLGEQCVPPQRLFPHEESELSSLSPSFVLNPEPVHQDALLREQIRAIFVGGSVSSPSCCF